MGKNLIQKNWLENEIDKLAIKMPRDLSNEELTTNDIPNRYDSYFWNQGWRDFALTFDGYVYVGGDAMTNLLKLYQPIVEHFLKEKSMPVGLTLSELRACLFMAQRLWRGNDDIEYLPLVFRQNGYVRQIALAFFTCLYFVGNYVIRMFAHLQPMCPMARLAAAFFMALSPETFGIRFLIPITGRRFATIIAVLI